jgi:hypothetical protein
LWRARARFRISSIGAHERNMISPRVRYRCLVRRLELGLGVLVVCGAALAGCGAAVGAGGGLLLALLVALAAFALGRAAGAGAPMRCDGTETMVCENGHAYAKCCPKGAKCNYKNPPFVDCGHATCVLGGDVGRCPSPKPHATAARSKAACDKEHGAWEEACIDGKVDSVCLPPMPTNYSGPGQNPQVRRCGWGRCTTNTLYEHCFPRRGETLWCSGAWTKVCLGGKVEERCLKKPIEDFPAAKYSACGDGSCAVGDKSACPR